MPFKGKARLPIDYGRVKVPSTVVKCPNCRFNSHFKPLTHVYTPDEKAWIIQECDNCKELILTIFRSTNTVSSSHNGKYVLVLESSPVDIFPLFRPIPDDSIPSSVADDYSQAILCFSAGAFDASVVMSRRAIETTAILLGANPTDRLVDKIRFLETKGLEKSLVELASEIRLFGNVPAAHPDKHDLLRKVKPEESKIILDFLEAFLESLYIRPAKIQKFKSKRTSKK